MRRPISIYAALLLLSLYAFGAALGEYRSGVPSKYLIGGYRGAIILIGFATLLFFVPRILRWPVGVILVFAGMVQDRSNLVAILLCVLSIVVGLWMFVAKIPEKKKEA